MFEMQWPPVTKPSQQLFQMPGIQMRWLNGISKTIITGDIVSALQVLPSDICIRDIRDEHLQESYALRMTRSQLMVVTPECLDIEHGWHPDGYSVSNADNQWAIIELKGIKTFQLLSRCISLDTIFQSKSVMVSCNGITCLLVVCKRNSLLFVESSYMQYNWDMMELNALNLDPVN